MAARIVHVPADAPVIATEVFRLVDTKFANNAELNSCSLNLRPLHLYDSIFYSHEFILHMRKFYWSTNLKTSVSINQGYSPEHEG